MWIMWLASICPSLKGLQIVYRIGVTGVGGGCGQGIVKSLRKSKLPMVIHKIDITPLSAGLFFGSDGLSAVLPPPEESLTEWERFIDDWKLDAIIPGSDHDLLPLSIAFRKPGRVIALTHNPNVIRIANDKAETYRTGIYAIPSIYKFTEQYDLRAFADEHGYPLIVKPRTGMTSRGLNIANNIEQLLFYAKYTEKPIVQKYIDGDEYTCAIYFNKKSEPVAYFQMRRWLYAGSTYRAEVTKDPIVNEFLHCVAVVMQRYKPTGALNIQMKVDSNGVPYLIEINARCSGSTAIRSHFGYNEPDMLLREYLLGEEIKQPETTVGVAFRYWNELFVDGCSIEEIKEFGW